jgi:hypothetical protein
MDKPYFLDLPSPILYFCHLAPQRSSSTCGLLWDLIGGDQSRPAVQGMPPTFLFLFLFISFIMHNLLAKSDFFQKKKPKNSQDNCLHNVDKNNVTFLLTSFPVTSARLQGQHPINGYFELSTV